MVGIFFCSIYVTDYSSAVCRIRWCVLYIAGWRRENVWFSRIIQYPSKFGFLSSRAQVELVVGEGGDPTPPIWGLTVMYLLTEREGRTEKYLVRGIRAVWVQDRTAFPGPDHDNTSGPTQCSFTFSSPFRSHAPGFQTWFNLVYISKLIYFYYLNCSPGWGCCGRLASPLHQIVDM